MEQNKHWVDMGIIVIIKQKQTLKSGSAVTKKQTKNCGKKLQSKNKS